MNRRSFIKGTAALLGLSLVNPKEFLNFLTFSNKLETQTSQNTFESNHYKEAKRRILEQHSIDMEKAFLYGIRS